VTKERKGNTCNTIYEDSNMNRKVKTHTQLVERRSMNHINKGEKHEHGYKVKKT
jgi:hypothetical protein